MKLDIYHKILLGVIALGLVGGVIGFRSWLAAHDAQILLGATQKAQTQAIAQLEKQNQAIVDGEKARDQAAADQLAAMQKLVAEVKTPQQIAQWIPQQLQTPQPITINVPKATPENPAPAATATIPQQDLASIRDQISSCQTCSVKLATAEQDLASDSAQLKIAGEKLSATEAQRDAALKAAHGTFWSRLWTRTKWFVLGAGAGAALVCGSGHC